jgi:hypothetical protein
METEQEQKQEATIEYDSTAETLKHVKKVAAYLIDAATEILNRAKNHDNSKLSDFEKEGFDLLTPILKDLTYGSEEYKDSKEKLDPYLQHHYANNRHHPEHFKNGIEDMTLFDVIEMLFDWKASSERHSDGNIRKSIHINQERFHISDQLSKILENTVDYMKW